MRSISFQALHVEGHIQVTVEGNHVLVDWWGYFSPPAIFGGAVVSPEFVVYSLHPLVGFVIVLFIFDQCILVSTENRLSVGMSVGTFHRVILITQIMIN